MNIEKMLLKFFYFKRTRQFNYSVSNYLLYIFLHIVPVRILNVSHIIDCLTFIKKFCSIVLHIIMIYLITQDYTKKLKSHKSKT